MFLQKMYQPKFFWSMIMMEYSCSYNINKQNSLNKPMSQANLFKKLFHQKHLSWIFLLV